MVTADHPSTAYTIAEKVGMLKPRKGEVMLSNLPDFLLTTVKFVMTISCVKLLLLFMRILEWRGRLQKPSRNCTWRND